jgi:N-acetylglutamate synthase-like GNAT family acetyltransferase
MTQGTWNLYLIGIDPKIRGQGRGAALINHVKVTLRALQIKQTKLRAAAAARDLQGGASSRDLMSDNTAYR